MQKQISLNQQENRIKTIAEAHLQINEYYRGEILDALAKVDINFPLLVVDFTTPEIDITRSRQLTTFSLSFLDQSDMALKTKRSEQDVFSDLMQIADDVIKQMRRPEFNETWVIESVSNGNFLKEDFAQRLNCVQYDVVVSTFWDKTYCAGALPSTLVIDAEDELPIPSFNYIFTL